MTGAGVATVARQEFRLRLRAGRWKWLLAGWAVLLVLFTLLATAAAGQLEDLDDDGVVVYGALTLFVLGLTLLVVPSLSAQSVNGDRERGTLASLQVTLLTPGEITLGKFVAAWGTAVTFLALSLPMVLFTIALGGVSLSRVIVVFLLLALLAGTVCAISLWLSAVLTRTTTSGVLSYLAVAAMTIGSGIAFGLGSVASQEHYTERYPIVGCTTQDAQEDYYRSQDGRGALPAGCSSTMEEYESTRTRTDRIWWLLAPNPFVIVADAAPRLGPVPRGLSERQEQAAQQARDYDVLGQLGEGVRELRAGPDDSDVLAGTGTAISVGAGSSAPVDSVVVSAALGEDAQTAAVWPWGLAFDVLLAAGALWLTARRLRTPSRTLPRGQRVA